MNERRDSAENVGRRMRCFHQPLLSLRPARARSELHARNLLVGGHNLISYLHHELKGKISFFHRDQRAVHIGAIAGEHPRYLVLGLPLQLADIVQRAAQGVGETRSCAPEKSQRRVPQRESRRAEFAGKKPGCSWSDTFILSGLGPGK